MSAETHKSPNYLVKIIGLVFLSSVVACNFCTTKPTKPENSPSPTPEELLPPPPPIAITQEMIDKATSEGSHLLAKVLQAFKDGNPVNIEETGSRNRTALHQAIFLERLDIIQVLLEKGANVNAKDQDGGTPLHTAAELSSLEVLALLLKANGIDVNAKDDAHQTAYHIAKIQRDSAPDQALQKKYQDIMDALIEAYADPNL